MRRTNGGLGVLLRVKLHDPGALGAAIRLVLDLGPFDLADGGEKLDEIVVAGRPGKLEIVNRIGFIDRHSPGSSIDRPSGKLEQGKSNSHSARGWSRWPLRPTRHCP